MSSIELDPLLSKILYNCAQGPDNRLLSAKEIEVLSQNFGAELVDVFEAYNQELGEAEHEPIMPFKAPMP